MSSRRRTVRAALRRAWRFATKPLDRLVLDKMARLGDVRATQIATAISRMHAENVVASESLAAIERERSALLLRSDPLVDGTLGDGGPFDAGHTVASVCLASKKPLPSRLLHLLVAELAPQQAIELGTNVGISSAYEAVAMKALGKGRLTTLDASPYRQRVAKALHNRLELDNVSYVAGLFERSLASTVRDLPGIDFAFIDGHHEYQPTLDYCETILANVGPDAVLIFDDIRWSAGMTRAWRELLRDERFRLAIDLEKIGVCVVARGDEGWRYSSPPISAGLF
jgi:predicted O-methyltransferase YrrM